MKSLVIYYSHTGENWTSSGLKNLDKGNTEIVAEQIAELTGADLFKVEAVKQYAYGYYDCCDEAKKELEANARPEIKCEVGDISEYDVIYIGAPVWWNHYPMPMFTALEKLDFTGKVVMPFSTHEGSGLGSFMADIKLICKGAEIENGLAIRGSDAKNCKSELLNWVKR